jgi:HEAT repeat protein
MRRLILVILALVVGLAVATAEESNVIETARTIALATTQLMETKEPMAVNRLKANIDQAIQRLKQMGEPARLELQKVLGEKRSHVTLSSAAYALYLADPTQVDTAVEALVKQMNRMGFTDLMLPERLVMAIGSPAVPTLTRHLNNSMVVQLLGSMGSAARDAVPALKNTLGKNNVEVAAALVKIGSDEAVAAAKPVLLEALKDPNNPHAKMAVIALGELGSKAHDAILSIRRALNAVDPDTRLYAASALADVGDTEFATKALAELIQNKELHRRYVAFSKLSSLGSQAKSAIPELVKVLQDDMERYGDRALAAASLTSIDPNNPEVAATLQKASREPELRFHLQKQGLLPQ